MRFPLVAAADRTAGGSVGGVADSIVVGGEDDCTKADCSDRVRGEDDECSVRGVADDGIVVGGEDDCREDIGTAGRRLAADFTR